MSHESFEGSSMEELHGALLHLVERFDKFCQQNEIIYYLMGGSALGAIRHTGFIPWDDDFDVFMDFENYQKFRSKAKLLMSDPLFFEDEATSQHPLYFSKVRLNGTVYKERDQSLKASHIGIFIDVMCLNFVSDNGLIRRLQYLSAKLLCAHALSKKPYTTKSKVRIVAIHLSKVLDISFLRQALLKFVRFKNRKRSKTVAHFFGRAKYQQTFFRASFLGQPRRVRFEGLQLPVPEKAEKYLVARFGFDYMEMPSISVTSRFPTHAVYVDVGKYKD